MSEAGVVTNVVLPYVNFFMFLGILYYFGKGPAAASAEKKKEDFETLFQKAQSDKKLAEENLAEARRQLENLHTELAKIKEDAQRDSDLEAQKIIQSGKDYASYLMSEAERIATNEAEKAQSQLQTEVLKRVRANVEASLKSRLDQKGHEKVLAKSLTHVS